MKSKLSCFRVFYRILGLFLGIGSSFDSQAVSNLPHFVIPGDFAFGLQSEFGFSQRMGLGLDARYTHGLNDWINPFGGFGVSGQQGEMRLFGGTLLDLFPDIQGQPGIGVVFTGAMSQFQNSKAFRVEAMPYLHKTFLSRRVVFEPFIAFPFSSTLFGGKYPSGPALVVGSLFEHSLHWRSHLEFGIPLGVSMYTFITIGVTYYH